MTTIEKIENYGAHYDPNSGLCSEDQLLVCEAIAESSPVIEHEGNSNTQTSNNKELSLRSSSSSACNLYVNDNLTRSIFSAIEQLKNLNYRSSRYEIAQILQDTFGNPRKETHWLWCAQHYCPQPIRRTLTELLHSLLLGKWSGNTPADYFTFLLKKRGCRAEIKKGRAE